MVSLHAITILVSMKACFSIATMTDAPATVTSLKTPTHSSTAVPTSGLEVATKQNSSTNSPPAAQNSLSQKELLGSFGMMGLTNKKPNGAPPETVPSQKSLLGSFGSLEKPTAKQDAPAAASDSVTGTASAKSKTDPQSCVLTDMCQTMNGICNHGKCVHVEKDCVADIKCLCDPGYQGQFCSVPIADVKETTTVVQVATPAMSTTTAVPSTSKAPAQNSDKNNGKQHVNGNVDIAKVKAEYETMGDSVSNEKPSTNKKEDINKSGSIQHVNGDASTQTAVDNASENANNNLDNGKEGQKLDAHGKHTNGNNGPGVNGNAANGKTDSISGNGKYDNGITSSGDNGNGVMLAETGKQKTASTDGSYRKGPEATLVSINNPISLETTKPKTQAIKSARVSVISSAMDTVTMATFSVKNTFVETVKQQTTRVTDVNHKISKTRKKQKEEETINQKQQQVNELNDLQTTSTPQTTEPPHTKVVIIDTSNNLTIKVLSNVNIKTQEQIVVTETNGSVNIQIKNADTTPVMTSDMVKPVETKSLKNKVANTQVETLSQSSTEQTVGGPGTAIKHETSTEVSNMKLALEGKTKDVIPAGTADVVSKENSKSDGSLIINKKQIMNDKSQNNDTAGQHSEQPSVFSPIIDLLKALQSPDLVQNSLNNTNKIVNPQADISIDSTSEINSGDIVGSKLDTGITTAASVG